MFPTLSHLLEYFFGVFIPLPVQTFGLMVAIAFLCAYWLFSLELQRKEKQGLLKAIEETETIGKGPDVGGMIINGLIGFLIGFKLGFALLNYGRFAERPQEFLLSAEGNVWTGLLVAFVFSYWYYADKKNHELDKPKAVKQVVRPHQLMGGVLLYAAIFGILGAKIFHNLEYFDDFLRNPWESLFSFSGLTFYGGAICGGAAVIYYTSGKGIRPLHMLDVGAPGLMLAYGVGRLGCQLSGDGDWGIPNVHPKPEGLSWLPDWAWSFTYPRNVIEEGVPIPGCTGAYCRELASGVYPTPLYEMLMAIILFFILWFLRKRIRYAGMLFSIFLIFTGAERFLIELVRVNSKYHLFGIAFTQAELISVILVIFGFLGLLYSRRFAKLHPETIAPIA